MTNQMSQNLSWFRQPAVSNYLTTDSTGACNTAKPLLKITNQMSQSLRYFSRPSVSNHLTTDTKDYAHSFKSIFSMTRFSGHIFSSNIRITSIMLSSS